MSDLDRDAIKARAEAATRGPWTWNDYRVRDLMGRGGDPDVYDYETEVIEASHDGECGCRSACTLELEIGPADAEFIAHARVDVPALLAALEEAERERDDLKMTLTELMPDPVLVEGSWIPVAEWPKILGNFMRSSAEYARESKAMWLRAESAERRIAAAEAECELYDGHWVDHPEDTWRFHADIRAALHPVAETTEKGEE